MVCGHTEQLGKGAPEIMGKINVSGRYVQAPNTDFIHRVFKIEDYVALTLACNRVRRHVENEGVRPSAAGHDVPARAADKNIVTGAAVENVVAGTAGNRVITGAAKHFIVAGAAADNVIAGIALQVVVAVHERAIEPEVAACRFAQSGDLQ